MLKEIANRRYIPESKKANTKKNKGDKPQTRNLKKSLSCKITPIQYKKNSSKTKNRKLSGLNNSISSLFTSTRTSNYKTKDKEFFVLNASIKSITPYKVKSKLSKNKSISKAHNLSVKNKKWQNFSMDNDTYNTNLSINNYTNNTNNFKKKHATNSSCDCSISSSLRTNVTEKIQDDHCIYFLIISSFENRKPT